MYFSYMFNFHSFLAGHSCTVKEYLAFMDGSNFKIADPSVSSINYHPLNLLLSSQGVKHSEEPSMLVSGGVGSCLGMNAVVP